MAFWLVDALLGANMRCLVPERKQTINRRVTAPGQPLRQIIWSAPAGVFLI